MSATVRSTDNDGGLCVGHAARMAPLQNEFWVRICPARMAPEQLGLLVPIVERNYLFCIRQVVSNETDSLTGCEPSQVARVEPLIVRGNTASQ